MTRTVGTRNGVILGGVLSIVAAFLAACLASWLFYAVWPDTGGPGRGWMIMPLAPFTAVTVLIAGAIWARQVRATVAEAVAALMVVEILMLFVVARVSGALFVSATFLFVGLVSLPFAPSWLCGTWIGWRLSSE